MTNGGIPPSARAKSGALTAVVVLGATVGPLGEPTPVVRRRVERAVALMRDGVGDLLVPTGGVVAGRPAEAVVMAALAETLGVSGHAILPESRARNTRENARFSLDLLAERGGVSTVVVVTDAWHLPRALMLFRRAARGRFVLRGCAAPVRAGHLGWWTAALRELPAFAADLVRGRRF